MTGYIICALAGIVFGFSVGLALTRALLAGLLAQLLDTSQLMQQKLRDLGAAAPKVERTQWDYPELKMPR